MFVDLPELFSHYKRAYTMTPQTAKFRLPQCYVVMANHAAEPLFVSAHLDPELASEEARAYIRQARRLQPSQPLQLFRATAEFAVHPPVDPPIT